MTNAHRHRSIANFLASERLGLVLCAIPKCASTTTRYWLARLHERDHALDMPQGEIHRFCRERYSLERLEPAAAARVLAASYRLAIVRDPLDRLASVFAAKFVRRDPPQRLLERLFAGPPASTRGPTFREFATAAAARPRLDRHWRPQVQYLAGVDFDLLAPIERTVEALRHAERRLGVQGPPLEPRASRVHEPGEAGTLTDVPCADLRHASAPVGVASLYDHATRETVSAAWAADLELYRAAQQAFDDAARCA